MDKHLSLDQVLELDILEQYTQAIGGKALLGSVDLFADKFPEYLQNLKNYFDQGEYDLVADEGHKMKGAAGAIGLARLSKWCEMIQSRNNDDWLNITPQVISLLDESYQDDINKLRDYLLNC